jgi:hypothetical protein
MGARRKFSSEYKREAVAMLDVPGVTVSQIAADLGIRANFFWVDGGVSYAVSPSRPLGAMDALGITI